MTDTTDAATAAPGDAMAPALPAGWLEPARLRVEGLDAMHTEDVPLPHGGGSVWLRPCRIRPADILACRLTDYQAATLALRQEWARADLWRDRFSLSDDVFWTVAGHCVLDTHCATVAQVGAWLQWGGPDWIARVCAVACGQMSGRADRIRRRALEAACLGLGDIPLSPDEIASAAGFAVNAGRAPYRTGG